MVKKKKKAGSEIFNPFKYTTKTNVGLWNKM